MNRNQEIATLRRTLNQMGNPFVELTQDDGSYLIECRFCHEVHDSKFGFQHADACPYEVTDRKLEQAIAAPSSPNDLQAIRARVETTYAGETVGRVVADVTFLMLATTELMIALEPFAAAFAEVPDELRSTLRIWDGEEGALHLSATTDHMKRAAEVVARYKTENSTGGES